MTRRTVHLLGMVVLLAALLPGLQMLPAAASDTVVIGLSVLNSTDAFSLGMSKGAQAAADDLQIDLVVKSADGDAAAELANVQDLIDQGVDALVIDPLDEGSAAAIAAANEAGIPVLLVGVDVSPTMFEADVVASVSPDNLQGGWLGASVLCDALQASGVAVELVGDPMVQSAVERADGFNQYMSAHCVGVTVQTFDTVGMDHDALVDAFVDYVRGNTVNGVFAYDDVSTLAALEATIIARQGGISFVGFDATDDAMSALQQGRLQAIVTPSGWALGAVAVDAANSAANGTQIPADIRVELGLLTLDSVSMFRDPGSGKFEGDPREGDFEGGPGSGSFEGGPGSGRFEGGPGSGRFEGGPGSGHFEGGPGSGSFEGGPGSGRFEGGPGSGSFE